MKTIFLSLLFALLGHAMSAQTVYSVKYKSDANVKVYVTDYASDADFKVFFADYKSDAGWKNSSKKHLMY